VLLGFFHQEEVSLCAPLHRTSTPLSFNEGPTVFKQQEPRKALAFRVLRNAGCPYLQSFWWLAFDSREDTFPATGGFPKPASSWPPRKSDYTIARATRSLPMTLSAKRMPMLPPLRRHHCN